MANLALRAMAKRPSLRRAASQRAEWIAVCFEQQRTGLFGQRLQTNGQSCGLAKGVLESAHGMDLLKNPEPTLFPRCRHRPFFHSAMMVTSTTRVKVLTATSNILELVHAVA
jgi:hypothetical protein